MSSEKPKKTRTLSRTAYIKQLHESLLKLTNIVRDLALEVKEWEKKMNEHEKKKNVVNTDKQLINECVGDLVDQGLDLTLMIQNPDRICWQMRSLCNIPDSQGEKKHVNLKLLFWARDEEDDKEDQDTWKEKSLDFVIDIPGSHIGEKISLPRSVKLKKFDAYHSLVASSFEGKMHLLKFMQNHAAPNHVLGLLQNMFRNWHNVPASQEVALKINNQ